MEQQEIFNKVTEIFKETFKDDTPLTMETALKDVKSWDSMGHIMFLSRLQEVFSIRFEMNDFVTLKSIGQIVEAIERLKK